MELTLAAALKLKNKLVREMGQHQGKFTAWNSYQIREDKGPTWDAKAEYEAYVQTMNRLVAVKTAIAKGNAVITVDILRMGELKNLVNTVRQVETKRGIEEIESRYDTKPNKIVEFKAVYNEQDVDRMVKDLETEIEACQERIDKHNHLTTITVPE